MALKTSFLHSYPQTKISSLIGKNLADCAQAKIVSGFSTPDGVAALHATASAKKISHLVLGSGTFKAFEALDGLIASGLDEKAARVHLGHNRRSGVGKNAFLRLRPMLHSKIYLFERTDGTSTAVVGSHNLTGFALRGMNGEAAVLLEGDSGEQIFSDIRLHVQESYRQAVQYDAALKEAYAKWYADYLSKLSYDSGRTPSDTEKRKTVVLIAELSPGAKPLKNQTIYFELDKRIEEIKFLSTEVHILLYRTRPVSPEVALSDTGSAAHSLIATVEAIDSGSGSAEIQADWFIDDALSPILSATPQPFRPSLRQGKQQVRAQITGGLPRSYEYLFEETSTVWEPVLGEEDLIDEETYERWRPVIRLERRERREATDKLQLERFPEMSPESGSYILFSRARRRR
jgi:HKD family nuclease